MRLLIFCFLASASLRAASFVTVTCVSPLGDPVTYTDTPTGSSCYADTPVDPIGPSRGSASASGSVTLLMATDPAQFNDLMTNLNVSASRVSDYSNPTGRGPAGTAQVTISYAAEIITEGPVRPGYLQIGLNSGLIAGNAHDGGMAGVTSGLSIDPDPYHFATTTAQFCPGDVIVGCTPGPTYFGVTRPAIPVTLGTVVTVFANGNAEAFGDSISGSSAGSLTAEFQFRFLEADAVTAVLASEIPEPTSIALFTVGLLGIFATSLRKRL